MAIDFISYLLKNILKQRDLITVLPTEETHSNFMLMDNY